MSDYEPKTHQQWPHDRYQCPCGASAIAVGWEVETVICGECGSVMEWDTGLYFPGKD